jgi:hypothetical protein
VLPHASQSRASAIDALHKALKEDGTRAALLPALPAFIAFLLKLIADPNFKIAISSMQIVGDLAVRVGQDIAPHLGCASAVAAEQPFELKDSTNACSHGGNVTGCASAHRLPVAAGQLMLLDAWWMIDSSLSMSCQAVPSGHHESV